MADPNAGNAEAHNNPIQSQVAQSMLTHSSSFKSRKKTLAPANSDLDDLINLLHGSDPVKLELSRLENDLRGKERELVDAHSEIKALKYSERLKEKAVEELTDELKKVEEKLKTTEALLESKNLEIKKVNDEKKAALAAQFAAESTLRRVHAAQKDDEMPPIEAIITPLEAELKLARLEAAKLQEDNRALDRLTKSKEAALLETERTVQLALAKASLVDDLQNKNQEMSKQNEICQEENKILDKLHRQKVAEVEKLSQTVRELEEAVLAGGAAANAVRDYQRKVQEMNEEKRTLDRELARAKVTANRVAVVAANEWKDANDKVMPVKQWLEDRRIMQGEMQQLKEKLAIAERATKSEAQLKEKYLLRLKVLEEGLKASPNASGRTTPDAKNINNASFRRRSLGGVETLPRSSSTGLSSRKTSRSLFGSFLPNGPSSLLKQAKCTSRSFDGGSKLLNKTKVSVKETTASPNNNSEGNRSNETTSMCNELDGKSNENDRSDQTDYVSGLLYDMLQKEVISLRKVCHEKDQSLKDKDDAIEMLAKKVHTLNKAMEVEAKRMKREVAAMEKEVAGIRAEKEHEIRLRRVTSSKASLQSSRLLSARSSRNS